MSDMYKETNCARCGVRFTIERSKGEPLAAFCTECEKKVNDRVAQRVCGEEQRRKGGNGGQGSQVRQRQ